MTVNQPTDEDKKPNVIDKVVKPIQRGSNAKIVILGLFALVGFLVLVFAITLSTVKATLSAEAVQVFTAAITGAFTLGGVIVTQLSHRPGDETSTK